MLKFIHKIYISQSVRYISLESHTIFILSAEIQNLLYVSLSSPYTLKNVQSCVKQKCLFTLVLMFSCFYCNKIGKLFSYKETLLLHTPPILLPRFPSPIYISPPLPCKVVHLSPCEVVYLSCARIKERKNRKNIVFYVFLKEIFF